MGEKLTENEETLDRIWYAIEAARCPNREGPYGLYDYGFLAPKRHRVRDFRDPQSDAYGEYVLCTDSREDAVALYQKLTRHHIAAAARRAALSREEGR